MRISTDKQYSRCVEQRPSFLKQKSYTVHARYSLFIIGIGGIAFVMAATQIWDPAGKWHKRKRLWLMQPVLCAPGYFVFLFYVELSKLWPVISYLSIAVVVHPSTQLVFLLESSILPGGMAQLMRQLFCCGRFQPGAIKKKKKKIGSSLS